MCVCVCATIATPMLTKLTACLRRRTSELQCCVLLLRRSGGCDGVAVGKRPTVTHWLQRLWEAFHGEGAHGTHTHCVISMDAPRDPTLMIGRHPKNNKRPQYTTPRVLRSARAAIASHGITSQTVSIPFRKHTLPLHASFASAARRLALGWTVWLAGIPEGTDSG